MKHSLTLPALFAAVVLAGATLAHSQSTTDATPPVKARHGIMQNYAFALGTLGGMAKGEVEYDAGVAQRAADQLAAVAALELEGYWPEGTSSEDLTSSRALPAIWEDKDDFMSGFEDLRQAARSMTEVASNGQEALGPAIGGIGKACGGCHEDYQLSKD